MTSGTLNAPQFVPPSHPVGIKINITQNIERQHSVQSEDSSSASEKKEEGAGDQSEFDPDAIVQEASEEDLEVKPKMRGRKFEEIPMQMRDKELSGLCSIM